MQCSTWIFVASMGLVAVALGACSDDEAAPTDGAGTDAGADGLGAAVDAGETPADAGSDVTADAPPSGNALGSGPFTLAYAGHTVGIDLRLVESGKASFDGSKLTSYEASDEERPLAGTNEVKEAASDDLVAIGRWAGGTTGGKFYMAGNGGVFSLPADGGVHLAIGKYTEVLPSSGAATYTELFKTAATWSNGTQAPGTVTGTLAATLAGNDTKVGFALTLTVPGAPAFTIATTGGSADVSTTEVGVITGGGKVKGAFYANNLKVTNADATCADTCRAQVRGFFAGPNADRIALVAHITKGVGGVATSVATAIAFQK